MEDFLIGFLPNPKAYEVHGRPVGVAVWTDGSLLVRDDGSNKGWRQREEIGSGQESTA